MQLRSKRGDICGTHERHPLKCPNKKKVVSRALTSKRGFYSFYVFLQILIEIVKPKKKEERKLDDDDIEEKDGREI